MVQHRRGVFGGLAALILSATAGQAEISYGGYTFDDRAFADRAEQLEAGDLELMCGAIDLHDALTGFSPDRQIVNIGYQRGGAPPQANDFAVYFEDLRAVEAPGPDVVFFETAFSIEGFEIAVRPLGGSFGPLQSYAGFQFRDTAERGCEGSVVRALEIDLADHGIASGGVVDGIRFRSLPLEGSAQTEGDPLMAAVLAGECGALPDSDADGLADACDCTPFGEPALQPGEPKQLRVLPDRETVTAAVDPSQPGATWQLVRGDLAMLRASGRYLLQAVDAGVPGDPLSDPMQPDPRAPLYYLVQALGCEGAQSSLGRNSFGVERVAE